MRDDQKHAQNRASDWAAAGVESVWGPIQKLNVERIGHGVRSIEDSKLVEFLKEKQTPLEVCVFSNLQTTVSPSIETHPVKQFFDDGL